MKLIYSVLVALLVLVSVSGLGSAWLSGYDHRMAITVNNGGASTLNYYQFNFTNNTNTLVAAGHMLASGADCRITDTSDNLIPFWNETAFNAAGTKIYANATTLAAGDNTFYMYYGNAVANSVTDGDETFMIFDGFDDGSRSLVHQSSVRYAQDSKYKMNYPNDLDIVNNVAYVASYVSGALTIFNVADKSNPVYLGNISGAGNYLVGAHDVKVVGNVAYVAAGGSDTLTTIDVSDPSAPTYMDHIGGAGAPNYMDYPFSVVIDGNYAFVTCVVGNTLNIFNISDPNNLVYVSHTTVHLAKPMYVIVEGNLVYVACDSSEGISIFDISTITNIVYVGGNIGIGANGAWTFDKQGDYLFVPDGGTYIRVYNVSDVSAITEVCSVTYSGASRSHCAIADGNYLYGGWMLSDSVAVFDISDLTAVTHLSTVSGAGPPNYLDEVHAMQQYGNYIFTLGKVDNAMSIFHIITSGGCTDGYSAGTASATQSHTGSYSLLLPSGGYANKVYTYPTSPFIIEYNIYIPSGQTGNLFEYALRKDNKRYLLNADVPAATYWGYLDSAGSYTDTGVSHITDSWAGMKHIQYADLTWDAYQGTTNLLKGQTPYDSVHADELALYGYAGKTLYIDDVRFRKYSSADPTSLLGAEEDTPTGITYIPPNPTNLQHTIEESWINYTWSAGSGNVTDSYSVLYNSIWYNGSTNTYKNNNMDYETWSNITVWAWNNSNNSISLSGVSQNTYLPVDDVVYIPPDPINIINTTGGSWIRHTWSVGSGNITDSYNVFVNGIWQNGSANTYYQRTYTSDDWQNITVFAYNNSAGGTLSLSSISQNTYLEYTGTQYFSKLKTMITEIIPLLSDVLLLVIAYVPILIGIVMVSFIMSICIGVFGKLKRW